MIAAAIRIEKDTFISEKISEPNRKAVPGIFAMDRDPTEQRGRAYGFGFSNWPWDDEYLSNCYILV